MGEVNALTPMDGIDLHPGAIKEKEQVMMTRSPMSKSSMFQDV